MSIQSEIVALHDMMLRKGASPERAHAIAQALYRELVPDCDPAKVQEAVTHALLKAKVAPPQTPAPAAAGAEDRAERREEAEAH